MDTTVKPSINERNLIARGSSLFASKSWLKELFQNALRSNATTIEATLDGTTLTVTDNGDGITSFQTLLEMFGSNWDEPVASGQNPAGFGSMSFLLRFPAEITSGNRRLSTTPKGIANFEVHPIETVTEGVKGTRVKLTLDAAEAARIDIPPREKRDGRENPVTPLIARGWVFPLCVDNARNKPVSFKIVMHGETVLDGCPRENGMLLAGFHPFLDAQFDCYQTYGFETGELTEIYVNLPRPRLRLEKGTGYVEASLSHHGQGTVEVNYNGYQLVTHTLHNSDRYYQQIGYKTLRIRLHNADCLNLRAPDRENLLIDEAYTALMEEILPALLAQEDKNKEAVKPHWEFREEDWVRNREKSPVLETSWPDYAGSPGAPILPHQDVGGGEANEPILSGGLPTAGDLLAAIPQNYTDGSFEFILPRIYERDCTALGNIQFPSHPRLAPDSREHESENTGGAEITDLLVVQILNGLIAQGAIKIATWNCCSDHASDRIKALKRHPVLGPAVREIQDFDPILEDPTGEIQYGPSANNICLVALKRIGLRDTITGREWTLDAPSCVNLTAPGRNVHYVRAGTNPAWEAAAPKEKAADVLGAIEADFYYDCDEDYHWDNVETELPAEETLAAIFGKEDCDLELEIRRRIRRSLLLSTRGKITEPRDNHTFHLKEISGGKGGIRISATYQDTRLTVKGHLENNRWTTTVEERKEKAQKAT